mgnify:CR=1 FL=1|jgi:hypothetical protein
MKTVKLSEVAVIGIKPQIGDIAVGCRDMACRIRCGLYTGLKK